MFCRIEYLNLQPGGPANVVLVRHHSAFSQGEMEEFAGHECQLNNWPGYRLHNLHTNEVNEVWD